MPLSTPVANFKLIDAFNDVKQKLRKMPLEDVQLYILQDAFSDFWLAAPWRWTVGGFSLQVTAGTADQPLDSTPDDILYFIDALFTDGQTVNSLHVESFLPTVILKGYPNKLWFDSISSPSLLKLSPFPATLPNTSNWYIVTRYKKRVPLLTPSNIRIAGTQIFNDEYWQVFKQGLLYYAYLWGDDQRAGSLTFADGKMQATGQLGLYLYSVQQMREREPLLTAYQNKPSEEIKA